MSVAHMHQHSRAQLHRRQDRGVAVVGVHHGVVVLAGIEFANETHKCCTALLLRRGKVAQGFVEKLRRLIGLLQFGLDQSSLQRGIALHSGIGGGLHQLEQHRKCLRVLTVGLIGCGGGKQGLLQEVVALLRLQHRAQCGELLLAILELAIGLTLVEGGGKFHLRFGGFAFAESKESGGSFEVAGVEGHHAQPVG